MSMEQKLCKVKIFQLQSMSNAIKYRSKVCVQEFSYIMSGLDIQLSEKSEYDSPVRKKLVAGGEIRRIIYCFFQDVDTSLWFSG